MSLLRRATIVVLALSLSGCTWITNYFSGKDNTAPPTPLTDIQQQLKVEKLWSSDLGAGSEERQLRLTPVIAEGKVYAADRKGRIRALSMADGSTVWDVESKAPISAGPGYGAGMVLVGTSDARVLAYRAKDGSLAWQGTVSSEVLAPPAAADGVVVVRTIDGRLAGLDAATGKRLWVYDSSVPALTLRGTSSPVIADGIVLSGFDNGHLVAVSLKGGKPLWDRTVAVPHGRSELERLVDIDGTPVVYDNTVYVVSYQGRVAALGLSDGQPLWSRDMSSFAGLAVDGTRVYVTDASSQVWCLDRFTGASFWKQDKLKWRAVTGPAVVGGDVVVGDLEGYLHWMSSDDGHFQARARAGSKGFTAAPVVSGNTMVVLGKDGEVTAFRVGASGS
jgi:outer membrane protein assembly factor BamB